MELLDSFSSGFVWDMSWCSPEEVVAGSRDQRPAAVGEESVA